MGLDGVEFVMALEESFDIAISDAEAQAMLTPRLVVEHLLKVLPVSAEGRCSEQRAFYRIRQAGMKAFALPREAFRPDVRWNDLLERDPAHSTVAWSTLREESGFHSFPRLLGGKIRYGFGRDRTIGETCMYVATRENSALRRPGEGWSRHDIEKVVSDLVMLELGIAEFRWDQTFRELGVD
jgi:hypothetical protein